MEQVDLEFGTDRSKSKERFEDVRSSVDDIELPGLLGDTEKLDVETAMLCGHG